MYQQIWAVLLVYTSRVCLEANIAKQLHLTPL
jgi:hypothetical protein